MSNFSYLYRTYYNFVSCLIFRQHVSAGKLQQIQQKMNFPMIDEVLDSYLSMERKFVNAMLKKSIASKQQDTELTHDLFDEMCLIVDKVAKRVSMLLF